MSSTTPRSAIDVPAMLWPPPLMPSSSPCSRANATACATSRAEAGWSTSAGTRAAIAFHTRDGVVPSIVAFAQQRPGEPRSERRELLGGELHPVACEPCDFGA